MIHRRFTLMSSLGDPIRGDIRFLEGGGKRPAVIVCHGFKGFKDWGFHPHLGVRLAEAGFVAVHFNLSRNGVGEDLMEFTEPEKFRKNTSTIELQDLATVIQAVQTQFPGDLVDSSRIGLLGHSRGGGLAILAAALHPGVKALVTWAAVSTFDRFDDPATVDIWRKMGYLDVVNSRTGQVLQMGIEYLDDLRQNKEKLDILAAASRLKIPFRLIHGTADESVSFLEAGAIRGRAKNAKPVELISLEGAGHTFGAAHPFERTTRHLEEAIHETTEWFERYMK